MTAAAAALAAGHTRRLALGADAELFVDVQLPRPLLVMVGGVHIAVALTAIAAALGYRTVVVDPRRAFGSAARFPHVDTLLQKWPDKAFAEIRVNQSTAIALLTHDPKIDDPALHAVLNSRAFYIGALGSRTTHAKRVARLQEAGFDAGADRAHPRPYRPGHQRPDTGRNRRVGDGRDHRRPPSLRSAHARTKTP